MNPSAQWVPVGTTTAGNAGFSTATGALTATSQAKFPLPNGRVIDVQAKVIPTGASVGGAVLRFAKKSLPLLSTGYAVYDLFQELGMTPNTSSGSLVVTKPTTTTNCLSSIIPNAADFIAGGQQMLCGSTWITSSGVATLKVAPDTCSVLSTCPDGSQKWNFTWTGTSTPTTAVLTDQEIIDAIANKSGWPSTSSLSKAVADAVASGEPLDAPAPTVSGPATAPGPTSTTTSGNTTTTTNNTYNINYSNNQVTYNTTSTTTINDGTTTTTSTTTTADDQPASECQKNPNSLNCADLDVPDGTIPKTTKNIAYTAETWFGGGSCPADKYLTTHGQQIKVWDWQSTCSNLVTYFRPVLLIVAAVMAMFIVLPKGAEV